MLLITTLLIEQFGFYGMNSAQGPSIGIYSGIRGAVDHFLLMFVSLPFTTTCSVRVFRGKFPASASYKASCNFGHIKTEVIPL